MIINKVSKRTNGLVGLAELQNAGTSIVKGAVQVRGLIGRVNVGPAGSIFSFFENLGILDQATLLLIRQVALADQFFITHNTPLFLIGKGFNDTESIQENIRLRITAFRVFEDAQRITSLPRLTLSKPLSDGQSLIDLARINVGYQRAATDLQTIIDTRALISIGKTLRETVTESELLAKTITTLRQDQTTVDELKALTPGKAIFDGVTVRNHDDPGPALFVTKLLRDSTTLLDLTGVFDGLTYQNIMYRFETIALDDRFAKIVAFNRKLSDTQTLTDRLFLLRGLSQQDATTINELKSLQPGLRKVDDFNVAEILQRIFLARRVFEDAQIMSEVRRFSAGLGKNDVATVQENLARVAGKVAADTATLIDLGIGKSAVKRLIDSVLMNQSIARLVGKKLLSIQAVIDAVILLLVTQRRFHDNVDASTQTTLSAIKGLRHEFSAQSQVYKNINKVLDKTIITADVSRLFVGKTFADQTQMQDLAAAFDGISYNYGLGKLDTVLATEEFVRTFTAFRTLQHLVALTDNAHVVRGLGFPARSDDFTLADTFLIGKIPVETLFIGSGQNQRSRDEEQITFSITKDISTHNITQSREVDFFAGYEEYLFSYAVPAGQSFTGSTIFASTSASAFVQVTSSGTGAGSNGGFVTLYSNYYISFQGSGTRSVTTVPLDLTTVSSANITFSVIAGNNNNGGEQPDLNEDLVIEYSINNGVSFVTAATILATDTYGYTGWFQYSTSVPTIAQTTSTILRWRQTRQSLAAGDNWGITDIRLGSTSFGTYVSTYYDNNTLNVADYLIKGQFRRLTDTARLLPTGYIIPITYYESWQQNGNGYVFSDGSPATIPVNSVVNASSTGLWYATNRDNWNYALRSTDGISWTAVTDVNTGVDRWIMGQDTSGQTLISLGGMATTDTSYSTFWYSGNGGASWASYSLIGDSRAENNSTGKGQQINNARYNSIPLFISGRATPAFIYTYPINSAGTTTAYAYLYSSSSGSYAHGQSWNRGGTFPDSWTSSNSQQSGSLKTSIYIEPLGVAYGSGVAVVHLQNYDLTLSKIYYLSDATAFPGNFTLSTSITNTLITGTTSTNAGYQVYARPNLAFGAGRFVWISPHGNVLTTTSPTVTASWQHYTVETTSRGIFASIAWDSIKQQFIIARNGTSTATSGFWYSTSGTQSSWIFKNNDTLRVDGSVSFTSSNPAIWPSTRAWFSSGSTSIAQAVTTFRGTVNRVGQLYTGQYLEGSVGLFYNDIDRTTFGYGVAAKQGVNRTFSSVTTTANDTDRLYIGGQFKNNYAVGIISGTTGTLVSSYTLVHEGNRAIYSEGPWFYIIRSFDGTGIDSWCAAGPTQPYYLTATKIINTTTAYATSFVDYAFRSGRYNYTIDPVKTTVMFSAWFKGDGSSVGQRIRLILQDTYQDVTSVSITLLSVWNRYALTWDATSFAGTTRGGFGILVRMYDPSGLATSANCVVDQCALSWGWQYNDVLPGTSVIPPYVKTTTTAVAAGTAYIEDWVTSVAYQAGTERSYYATPVTSITVTTSYSTLLPGNLILNSQDMSNVTLGSGYQYNGYISSNVATAPDGTLTADRFYTYGYIRTFQNPNFLAPGVYHGSVFVKGEDSSVGQSVVMYFWQNSFAYVTGASVKLTNQWQRLSVICTSTNATLQIQVGLATNSYMAEYGAQIAPDQGLATLPPGLPILVWGFQLTTGATRGAYTASTSAVVPPAATTSAYVEYSYDPSFTYTAITRAQDFPLETVVYNAGKRLRDSSNIGANFNTRSGPSNLDINVQAPTERLTFAITKIAKQDTTSVNSAVHPAQIGFGTNALGVRVHGSDLERVPFTITKIAKQANYTAFLSGSNTRYFSSPQIVRGNLIKYSEDLGQLAANVWVTSIATVTPNSIAAPYSLARTAAKITETNTTLANHYIYPTVGQSTTAIFASGLTVTVSVHFKAAERHTAEIAWSNYVNSLAYASFNLSSGTIISTGFWEQYPDVGDWTSIVARINAVGDGWYRCSLTATKTNVNGGASQSGAPLFLTHNGTTSTYVGIAGAGMYVWGAQVEFSDTVGPYLQTTGTQIILASNQSGDRDFVLTGDPRASVVRSARNQYENLSINFSKSLEAGSDLAIVVAADRSRTSSLFIRGPAFTQETQNVSESLKTTSIFIRGPAFTQEDLPIVEIQKPIFNMTRPLPDVMGDLDPFGNINTMVSQGTLRITNYVDIEYLTEDYVGESRSIT